MKAVILMTLAAVLATATIFSGCRSITPGGVTTEKKEFVDFTDIAVEGTFDVEITQASSFGVNISSDTDFADYVVITKEGSKLRISLNPHNTFTDFTRTMKPFKAKINLPALNSLLLSGASKGTVSGFKSTKDFSLDISGGSSLNLVKIEVGNAQFKISGASTLTGEVSANMTRLEVSGASRIELTGLAEDVTLTGSGTSKTNLDNFPVSTAGVSLSGASEANLNIKERLDAVLKDASTLYFRGNPSMGNISVAGASTIKHK